MLKRNQLFIFLSLLAAAALVACDQAIKAWAVRELSPVPDIRLIPGVLHLMYRENYGAAFSILWGRAPLLVAVTSIVLFVLLFALLAGKVRAPTLIASFSLVLAGGAGNLVDRVMRGYVVDYIYFVPINFPVFNLADCCVVCGTGLIVVYLLFIEPRQERAQKAGGGHG